VSRGCLLRSWWAAALLVVWMSAPGVSSAQAPADPPPEEVEEPPPTPMPGPAAEPGEPAEPPPPPPLPDPRLDDPSGTPGRDATQAPSVQPAPPGAAPAPPPPPSARDGEGAGIPLRVGMTGFYRARLNHIKNVPMGISGGVQDSARATYAFQNLRLRPHVKYGTKDDAPIAALYVEADAFSNVLFGDNARVGRTPIFADSLSLTNNEGFDLRDSFLVRRAWAEFLIPVGQIRVGRMPLEWGLGILAQNDNRLQDWGDPQFGSTVDRILFATRPLTVYNALAKGDARTTPLIFAVAYDKLVKDPLNDLVDPPDDPEAARNMAPFGAMSRRDNDVSQMNFALLWKDDDFGRRVTDELSVGYFMLYRWQNLTNSTVFVHDVMWKFRYGLGPGKPSIFTEGEFVNIHGESGALPFADVGCSELPCPTSDVSIFGAVGRIGLIDEQELWKAWLEVGYSSGDQQYFADDNFSVRPFHPDYRVGLLTYQVALASRTAQAFLASGLDTDGSTRALWSRGGVWNSKYIWPQVKYTLIPGIELHGAVLLSWADKVPNLPTMFNGEQGNCGFSGGCFIGMEVDGAVRIRWADNDMMWFDIEGGYMRAGKALSGPNLAMADRNLWTIQSRVAMQF
jgi:hypothetical protein